MLLTKTMFEGWLGPTDSKYRLASTTLIKLECWLGYTEEHSICTGLHTKIAWYKCHTWLVSLTPFGSQVGICCALLCCMAHSSTLLCMNRQRNVW